MTHQITSLPTTAHNDSNDYLKRFLREWENTTPSYQLSDWKQLDIRITELGRERAAHEHEVCRRLLEAKQLGVPRRVGFASLREYAQRRLGLNGRQTEERLRVGRALADLPALGEALCTGALYWTAVRELTRIALPETDAAWRAWASGRGSREVQRAVASRQPGDLPSTRPDPSLIKHRLSFEVRAETMALFRDLQAAVRSELGGGDIDDDALLCEIARRALGGPEQQERAPYQVAVSRCDSCQLVAVEGGGETHPVDAVVEDMISCDSQHIPAANPLEGAQDNKRKRATQTIPPATRRGVLRRQSACAVPGCRNHRHRHVHHMLPRSEGGGHDPLLLVGLCHRHHMLVHAGALVVDGDAHTGFSFRHADGTAYGQPLEPAEVDIAKKAFVEDAVQRHGAPDTLEAFVQAALRASS